MALLILKLEKADILTTAMGANLAILAGPYSVIFTPEAADELVDDMAKLRGQGVGLLQIARERRRQIEKGYTPDHDAHHTPGDLVRAAICYAMGRREAEGEGGVRVDMWPAGFGEPGDLAREDRLAGAGALIAAAIDLQDRLARASSPDAE